MSNPLHEDAEAAKARRRRNIVLAIGLAAMVLLTFFVTIAKLGGHVADRTF